MASDYEVRSLSYPEDLEGMLDVGDQAFASDPVSIFSRSFLSGDESWAILRAWRKTRLMNSIEGRIEGNVETHWVNAIYKPKDSSAEKEKLVASIGFHVPAPDSEKLKLTPHPMVPALEDLPPGNRKAHDYYMKMDGMTVEQSKKFIGPDRNTHYWYLASLATLPEHQHRGLGTRLVLRGIDLAREDAKARPGKIRGVWTIATPKGLKTYLKAGMKEVGSFIVDYGKGGGENGQKYVWLLLNFDEE